jgi:hypothetical protein
MRCKMRISRACSNLVFFFLVFVPIELHQRKLDSDDSFRIKV